MIVVDTSVWVDHFRKPMRALSELLSEGSVALHPFVYGELLLGGLPSQSEAAVQLLKLQRSPLASASETAAFIEWAGLVGTGVGYVDTHLLVAAKLQPEGKVMSYDKRLRAQAERLGLAYAP